jgi:hypothetical protein
MTWSETSASADLLYRFERRFGPAEARALVKTLAAADPGSHVTLDFSDVREFEDVAVGALAEALTGCTRDLVDLRGLSLHQRRMLRYLGTSRPASNRRRISSGAAATAVHRWRAGHWRAVRPTDSRSGCCRPAVDITMAAGPLNSASPREKASREN